MHAAQVASLVILPVGSSRGMAAMMKAATPALQPMNALQVAKLFCSATAAPARLVADDGPWSPGPSAAAARLAESASMPTKGISWVEGRSPADSQKKGKRRKRRG